MFEAATEASVSGASPPPKILRNVYCLRRVSPGYQVLYSATVGTVVHSWHSCHFLTTPVHHMMSRVVPVAPLFLTDVNHIFSLKRHFLKYPEYLNSFVTTFGYRDAFAIE